VQSRSFSGETGRSDATIERVGKLLNTKQQTPVGLLEWSDLGKAPDAVRISQFP
jgi:hypothetical protein